MFVWVSLSLPLPAGRLVEGGLKGFSQMALALVGNSLFHHRNMFNTVFEINISYRFKRERFIKTN
jgi:hypothetical protein